MLHHIIVYVLGRQLILSHKNNEDAVFISICKYAIFVETQFNVNDFLQEITKINRLCSINLDIQTGPDE